MTREQSIILVILIATAAMCLDAAVDLAALRPAPMSWRNHPRES